MSSLIRGGANLLSVFLSKRKRRLFRDAKKNLETVKVEFPVDLGSSPVCHVYRSLSAQEEIDHYWMDVESFIRRGFRWEFAKNERKLVAMSKVVCKCCQDLDPGA